MKRFAPLALVAALALAGCTQAAEITPGPSVAPAVNPSSTDTTGQPWADSQIKKWAKEYKSVGVDDITKDQCLKSWSSDDEGTLKVFAGCKVDEGQLSWISGDILRKGTGDDLQTVIAVNEKTGVEVTCSHPNPADCETNQN